MGKSGPGLQVINAGYPKTGTKTIHEALRILGYNVCDVQENVYSHYADWNEVWQGDKPQGRKALQKLYGKNNENGYTAVCDTPTCFLWDTLLDEFPEAKVIHVVRDDEKWWASLEKHIQVEREQFLEMWFHRAFGPIYRFIFNHSSKPFTTYMDFYRPLVIGAEDPNFRKANKDVILKRKQQHDMWCKEKCPKEKRLEYRIGEGWEPICKFLNKPVPNVPFPHMNRMGSVVAELANHPDYIRTMKRQFFGWFLRTLMVAGAYYVYKNPETLPDQLEFGKCTLKTIGACLVAFIVFLKA